MRGLGCTVPLGAPEAPSSFFAGPCRPEGQAEPVRGHLQPRKQLELNKPLGDQHLIAANQLSPLPGGFLEKTGMGGVINHIEGDCFAVKNLFGHRRRIPLLKPKRS